MKNWIRCENANPPDGVPVHTKVDDREGVRNEQVLKNHGRLWFFPDGSMYVYYTPTHWAALTEAEKAKRTKDDLAQLEREKSEIVVRYK